MPALPGTSLIDTRRPVKPTRADPPQAAFNVPSRFADAAQQPHLKA